ncbi:LuxR family two component transcriptional regulator [Prosthecobacter fusiformis]|uniref:LuxR family two component transcriptional regulator n=1 Tax=Prosthecobacter fusiformis TaxID=48464 RepID=A0A4R7SRF0_9BACT|nr:response regulator transcription factor [Prosthecobacter fusiformis]TDU80747.1 LuxR family two component transcriptional regulator [Prosthecobacter fusiformis]
MKTDNLIRVWIVEDHDIFRRSLLRLCTPAHGLAPGMAFANAETMLTVLRNHIKEELPQVLLLDVGLPGRSGLDIIGDVHRHAPECRIVILTVFEDEAKISQAISAGASGYLLKTTRAETVAEAVLEAHQGGSPMSPKVAASVVQMLARLTKPAAAPVSLSKREQELLALLVEGLTAKEIADRLEVSIHTTGTHTRNLFSKLGVHSRAAAVARALRERLV